jgi:ABC transporter, permease protein
VYDITFGSRQYGIATALGLFKSLISGAFIVTGWFLAHKCSGYRVF